MLDLPAIENVHRPCAAHDRQLHPGPNKELVRPHLAGAHRLLGPAVALAQHHRDLRHGRLRIGVEELGAVANNSLFLLLPSWKESGHVHQGHNRDIKSIAEANEARPLIRGVHVQASRQEHRLIGDKPDGVTIEPPQSDGQIARELGLEFEKIPVVHHRLDDLEHVISLAHIVGNNFIQRVDVAHQVVRRVFAWRRGLTVGGQETQ